MIKLINNDLTLNTINTITKKNLNSIINPKIKNQNKIMKQPPMIKITNEKAPVKKALAKKSTIKAIAKKSLAKKTTIKDAAKKAIAKKSLAKKTTIKDAAKKATIKIVAKKAPVKKVVAKKVVAKKAPVKKVVAKKAPVKKALAKKVVAKKAPVKKALAKKVVAKKAPLKKLPVIKAAAKKSPVKESFAKKYAAKKAQMRKLLAKKPTMQKIMVSAKSDASAIKQKIITIAKSDAYTIKQKITLWFAIPAIIIITLFYIQSDRSLNPFRFFSKAPITKDIGSDEIPKFTAKFNNVITINPKKSISNNINQEQKKLTQQLKLLNLWTNIETIKNQKIITTPRIAFTKIPPIIKESKNAQFRKNAFISIMLPLALLVNEEISDQRSFAKKIQNLHNNNKTITKEQQKIITQIFKRYETKYNDFKTLLPRINTIPIPLILAQAAAESGWGTSRFSVQGNALFGQITTSSKNGIQAQGSSARLQTFKNIFNSVRSYARNLNTLYAYKKFRNIRSQNKNNINQKITWKLIDSLKNYAEKKDYNVLLKNIITTNHLIKLNQAQLQTSLPENL